LISQLPPPLILLGDFNAKNILWGAAITDERGRLISDVCAGFDMILLSSGARTHLCLMSWTLSALDLTFCSLGLAVHLEWSILADLHGSDHYALNLHAATRFPILSRHPNWIIRHADWESFSVSYIRGPRISISGFYGWTLHERCFTGRQLHIPLSSSRPRRLPVPWWTYECRAAIRTRKRALRHFQAHLTLENLIAFKRLRSTA
jgi:hypothetical protein